MIDRIFASSIFEFVLIVSLLVAYAISLVKSNVKQECINYGALKNKETDYKIRLGCTIKDGDKWFTEEEYKYKEGLSGIGKSE